MDSTGGSLATLNTLLLLLIIPCDLAVSDCTDITAETCPQLISDAYKNFNLPSYTIYPNSTQQLDTFCRILNETKVCTGVPGCGVTAFESAHMGKVINIKMTTLSYMCSSGMDCGIKELQKLNTCLEPNNVLLLESFENLCGKEKAALLKIDKRQSASINISSSFCQVLDEFAECLVNKTSMFQLWCSQDIYPWYVRLVLTLIGLETSPDSCLMSHTSRCSTNETGLDNEMTTQAMTITNMTSANGSLGVNDTVGSSGNETVPDTKNGTITRVADSVTTESATAKDSASKNDGRLITFSPSVFVTQCVITIVMVTRQVHKGGY